MQEPYIKLYKKMLDWEWYDDPNTMRVFLHCLLRANWKPGSWHGINYSAGEFITSLQTLAVETNLSIKQVRVALNHLIETGEVASKRQSKCRIITVNNWSLYQGQGNQKDSQRAIKGQDEGNQRATDKEYKEIKNIKKYYDDPDLDKAFSDYVAMRKQIKKPMTDKAVLLAKKKLNDLSGGNTEIAIMIIDQSVMNSWQGLFPLRNDYKQEQQKSKSNAGAYSRKYDFDELERMAE